METQDHGSIVAFGYRNGDIPPVSAIASRVQKAMQVADDRPAVIAWDGDEIAILDHIGIRVAIGRQEATAKGYCSHLVMAVGNAPDMEGARPNRKTHTKRADRLAAWVQQTMPYDTILRAETPEDVDAKLVRSFLELLVHAEGMVPEEKILDAQPDVDRSSAAHTSVIDPPDTTAVPEQQRPIRDRFDPSGIIEVDDLANPLPDTPQWLQDHAKPTQPLRLTVHTVALSLMLYSAPLGAFLFTYSMLRDITKNNKEETAES